MCAGLISTQTHTHTELNAETYRKNRREPKINRTFSDEKIECIVELVGLPVFSHILNGNKSDGGCVFVYIVYMINWS